MAQVGIIVFGIITFLICLSIILYLIFIPIDTLTYTNNDEVTDTDLSKLVYKNINNFYNYQCYGFAFEIYTNLECEKYLTANINNENIKYYNQDCYPIPNENCVNYNENDVIRFCRFFKNQNFCNVVGY